MRLWIISVFAAVMTLALACPGFANASESAGAKLFQSEHCVMCHGANGKGFPAIHTPDFTSAKWQAAHTDAQITQVIKNGKPGTPMAAFGGKLTASQIQDLVEFIRSLGDAKKK